MKLETLYNRTLLLAICAVAALDQLSKHLISLLMDAGEILNVIPGFFNVTYHHNRGAAFGMMANLPDGYRQIALAITTVIALGCVGYFILKGHFSDLWGQLALGMIVGGAVGNIIDRIRFGQVVDFLDFYISHYHWPAFNVADSSICIGVFILLIKKPAPASGQKGVLL